MVRLLPMNRRRNPRPTDDRRSVRLLSERRLAGRLPVMIRFLHTADWQLGLKLAFVAGDRGARARLERFAVVERIARLAHERRVDAVVVAGDVFDDNAIGRDTLQAARDVLERFAPIPVLLLPGNHDAATLDCALARLPGAGPHVRPLLDHVPIDVAGARFWPCPLLRRHERQDPTRHLPARAPGDPVLVALAHGGVVDFGEEAEAPNRIDVRAVLARGYDYMALGDWHGTLGFDDRAWYAGTPEPTRFKEKDPGNVLLVEIGAPGAAPRVEKVRVARTRWLREARRLDGDADVDALAAWLAGMERSWTLLELALEGALSFAARARLDAILEARCAELMYLRVDDSRLVAARAAEDLEALEREGFVGDAARALREGHDPRAADAARLLHRLWIEAGHAAP